MTGHALTRRAWSRSRRGLAGRTILRVLVWLPLRLATWSPISARIFANSAWVTLPGDDHDPVGDVLPVSRWGQAAGSDG
jgi:hypothetical protein